MAQWGLLDTVDVGETPTYRPSPSYRPATLRLPGVTEAQRAASGHQDSLDAKVRTMCYHRSGFGFLS